MTSLVGDYWQLVLAQGVCQGFGNGLVFTPTVALLSTYFEKKRAVAVSFMTSGTATGGVVVPIVARQLIPRIGFAWTVRVMGFIVLANSAVVLALAKSRTTPRRAGPLIELAAFRDPWYSFFGLGLLLALLGLYFGYFYVSLPQAFKSSLTLSNRRVQITPFAQTTIHTSSSASFDLLLVINAMGLPGRVVPAWIADRFLGPLNTLILTVAASGILLYAWAAVTSLRKG